MKKTDKNKVKEFIRVDHAGERGAIKIYEGQLLALSTFIKDDNLKKKIEEMKIHEKEHCEYFENEIKKRNIKPTKFLPLWDLLGVGLGFGSTILGKKATMLCTASVEEVIDEHYLNQINELEKPLNASLIAPDGLSLVTPVNATEVIAKIAMAPIGIALPIMATTVPINKASKCHAFSVTPCGGGTANQSNKTMAIEISPEVTRISVPFIKISLSFRNACILFIEKATLFYFI